MEARTENFKDMGPVSCGLLRYTCEKQPRITYMNGQMRKLLRFPEEGSQEAELYRENIYFLIPPEERGRFAGYLNRAQEEEEPLAGDMTFLRCDGTRIRLFGWVMKEANAEGVEEFQSVCMDVTERYQERTQVETGRYLKALTDVYDKIFQYDLAEHTVTCLYGPDSPVFQKLEQIPMQMREATSRWIRETVLKEDQEGLEGFFADFYEGRLDGSDGRPAQIRYRALASDGQWKNYMGIFLKLYPGRSLFCCRNVPDTKEACILRSENAALKENMQELVMRFTDGLAAFEITDEYVTPLYASDNVCEFFGFTREEWLSMMKRRTPNREFVSRSRVSYEEFLKLLQEGEADFTYYDLDTEQKRRVKAVCSRKSPSGSAPRYVMLYNVEEERKKPPAGVAEAARVSIRTFGYFDVFVGDRPIAFRNKKSKELFALLVDRRGGYVSSEEAISFLWEEEPVNAVTLARYRKVALRLKNILEEYGISEVVESVDGKRRIATDRVRCDLYDYLSGREESAGLFKGSYLTNYSWGENTLAELTGELLFTP